MADAPRYRFPGMDPWLEHPAHWRGVHHEIISELGRSLNPQLLPRYVACVGVRLVVETAQERDIYPDVVVYRQSRRPQVGLGGQTVDPAVAIITEEAELEVGFIEIRMAGAEGRLVTVIEVLSPANKHPGVDGFEKYRQKQAEVLASNVHLVEIDLLREGEHTVAVPPKKLAPHRPYDYLVTIRPADRRSTALAYPIRLRNRLPRFPVPLAAPDPDAVVDLQSVVERVYDAGGYGYRLKYGEPPVPPLSAEDAAWAAEILKSIPR